MDERRRPCRDVHEQEWLRMSCGDFEAATPEQQRAFARALLAYWQANDQHQRQLDLEADHRAFERGYVDEPGPIDNSYSLQSSTTRTAKP